jgi:hypothetical protein
MTVAEGLVSMWLADALGDMRDNLRQQTDCDPPYTVVDLEQTTDPDGRPVLRLRVGRSGAVRVTVVEEPGEEP